MDEKGERWLVYTYPELPEGAGFYEHPDGQILFYNCAPGQPSQAIGHETLPPYYVVNADGTLAFDKDHFRYQYVKGGLQLAGIDIDTIQTEAELLHLTLGSLYGKLILECMDRQAIERVPKNLDEKINKAIALKDFAEVDRLQALQSKMRTRKMTVVTDKNN